MKVVKFTSRGQCVILFDINLLELVRMRTCCITQAHLSVSDLCSDLPELEIVSLLSEGQPTYTLRADSVFGYDNDDWLHTTLLPPEVSLGLTYDQIEETLKYFCEFCFIHARSNSLFIVLGHLNVK